MKVVGTRDIFTREELTDFMRAKIIEYSKTELAKTIDDQKISILSITSHMSELSELMQGKLTEYFDQFGLTLDNFSFNSISPFEEDLAAINAKKIEKRSKQLEGEGNAIQMDIESEALARKRAREGYTYQQERGMDVMQSAASNEGSMSSGFLGAGMGLGMGVGVGGAVGAGFNDLAHQTVNGAMGQGQPQQSAGTACPSCGHINPAGAKFCQECGTKLEAGIRCPSCGHINPAGAKFCQECGAKLGGATHCPNCGTELEPGAKFCPECGTKIE